MKALIIDDHKVHRLYLRNLINENFPFLDELDEAESVTGALKLLDQFDYNLIFLDMELSDGMGFDILKEMKEYVYAIVVSSHKEYAIEAFKHQVVDYILKPVNVSEFKNAVNRVVSLQERIDLTKSTRISSEKPTKIETSEGGFMVSYNNTFVTINKKDILFIKALGKNSEIYMSNNATYTSYKNLKEFETVLCDDLIRIHHSYLVNKENIVSFCKDRSHVILHGGAEVPVSVRKRDELFKNFKVF